MIRHCKNCDKSFDFNIRDTRQLDNLICPECGAPIDKNSRPKPSGISEDQVNYRIGKAYMTVLTIIYLFGLIIACLGVFGFFSHLDTLLFIMVVISAIVLIIQLATHYTSAFWLFMYIAGAVIGGIVVANKIGASNIIKGISVGLEFSIILRYIIRDLFFRLLFALIRKSEEKSENGK